MHRASVMTSSYPAMAAPAGNVMSYFRCFCITVWFFSLVAGLWWRQEAGDIYEMMEAGVNLKGYFYVGLGVAFAGHLTLGLNSWLQAPFRLCSTPTGALLTLFCLFAVLTSIFSVNYRVSILYGCATWGVVLLCSQFWQNNYDAIRRMLPFTGLVLLAWIVILLIHHGQRFSGSGIGGINRNTTSHIAMAGMVCILLSRGQALRWFAIVVALFLAVVVTSRGTVLAMLVFVGVYYALHKGTSRAAVHSVLFGFCALAALLAFDSLRSKIGDDLLRMESADRGVKSGFSGRVERWKRGFELFSQSPIIGHGFRTTTTGIAGSAVASSHSGYLKLLSETGMVGFALIMAAVLWALYAKGTQLWRLKQLVAKSDNQLLSQYWDSIQVNAVAVSLICAILVLWVYEPIYINIGAPLSLCFLMMMVAPPWIGFAEDSPPVKATQSFPSAI